MFRRHLIIWSALALLTVALAITLLNSNSFARLTNNQTQSLETRCCPPATRTQTDATSVPVNSLTGTLTLPSGWITTNPITVSFQVTASPSFGTGSFSNDEVHWGPLIPVTNNQSIAAVWNLGNDGVDKKIYLRLDSANGQVQTIIRRTLNVDTKPPVSTMVPLPPFSSRTFPLSWFATDETSGVASYDVELRVGETGAWTALLNRSTLTKATFDGSPGDVYYFRVRAIDLAGNVEPWRTCDATTSIPQTD